MKKKRILNIIIASIVTLISLFVIGRYTYVHEEHIERGEVIKKEKTDHHYYVFVQPEGEGEAKELLMEEKMSWHLVQEGEIYNVHYSWYGAKEPTIEEMERIERE
ncbi:hypothetical protein [Pseudalkalibacillus hwajinpoensis]|uniref:YxeA family protein n=1 Tax=Guptibacillus hwajinpoensis TaxID=208199 RepID=A0A4U1MEX8_9BACL|nr:hypothetical protein [Pseudalkalibacillus hwajinpoensis]TKD68790.1 hypothetical protein FBF83_16450 [Pseudalkalibacillus hwajinpoensis]